MSAGRLAVGLAFAALVISTLAACVVLLGGGGVPPAAAQPVVLTSSGVCPTTGIALNPGAFCWRTDTRTMFVWDSAAWRQLVTLDDAGGLTGVSLGDGSSSAPSLRFTARPTMGWYRSSFGWTLVHDGSDGLSTALVLESTRTGGQKWAWTSFHTSGNFSLSKPDTGLAPFFVLGAAPSFALNITATGGIGVGSVGTALAPQIPGDITQPQTATASVAPGTNLFSLRVRPGTGAGTCKLVAVGGTSSTEVTVIDNVGAGCS